MQKTTSSLATMRGILALVLVICLVECTTEQRIDNRGSKASNLIQKVNGWRSQRGGSCLSYGHSCWGAHGKRSGKEPSSAPDWYITRILRRMAANSDLNNSRDLDSRTTGDIYQANMEDLPNRLGTEVISDIASKQAAKPMLDEDLLSNMKFWQMMKLASEEN
ncbi:neuropeptide CCHamide-1 isoform X2 [Danaus plexippus]|uniref:neuropeptide CCHamide-1 isoform X2 n=1 Tax=Danaus plexippus TaxID=13037 RepID=UPI0013C461AE|nr:neuropeptide CCHamide-1 isoform X2 [Danaus plexippus]